MEKNKRNEMFADLEDIFLVSAYNHIESVKRIYFKNKKRNVMARAGLELAQKDIAYVLRLHEQMGE